MIYLLDTNTCIVYLRTPLGPLAQKLLAVSPIDIGVSAITLVELYRGAYLSTKASTNLAQVAAFVSRFTVLTLESSAAEIAGRVDAELARQGQRIGPYDTLIAAVALVHN